MRKIVAFTQKWLLGEFGASVAETVAEVEFGGVAALTVTRISHHRSLPVRIAKGRHGDAEFLDKTVEQALAKA